MKTCVSLDELYAAKAKRREWLSGLPIDERVSIIEKLHELGLTLREARQAMVTKSVSGEGLQFEKLEP